MSGTLMHVSRNSMILKIILIRKTKCYVSNSCMRHSLWLMAVHVLQYNEYIKVGSHYVSTLLLYNVLS